jgi:uncharacterized OsmC-like protein
MSGKEIQVELVQEQDYRFTVKFASGVACITTDEPSPLGSGQGPSPVEMLSAAVGNCLSDSLLFALRKFKLDLEPLRAVVHSEVGRNEQGRMRVQSIKVDLHLGKPSHGVEHLDRVLNQFQDFCTVTQSVGESVDIVLSVYDSTGLQLKTE